MRRSRKRSGCGFRNAANGHPRDRNVASGPSRLNETTLTVALALDREEPNNVIVHRMGARSDVTNHGHPGRASLRNRGPGRLPAFWTLPTAFLTGVTAAAGIATVNSLGNVSGFVGPYWVGAMTDLFGSAQWGLVTIGVVMVLGAVVVSVLGDAPREPAPSPLG